MDIWNDGTQPVVGRGNYGGNVYRAGQDGQWLKDRVKPLRSGVVKNYPRLSKHVWHLVVRMLQDMGYG